MELPYSTFPQTRRVQECLNEGKPVLLMAPRYFGKRQILQWLVQYWREDVNGRTAFVDLEMFGDRIDIFASVWEDLAGQLRIEGGENPVDKVTFQLAAERSMRRFRKRVLVLVRGGSRTDAEVHYDLLCILCEVQDRLRGRITVIGTDDYSLVAHSMRANKSLPAGYEPVYFSILDEASMRECMRTFLSGTGRALGPSQLADLSKKALELTGGHPGLVRELLLDLRSRGGAVPRGYWDGRRNSAIMASHVLSGIRRAVESRAVDLAKKALEYVAPGSPSFSDPLVEELRELGVIVLSSPPGGYHVCPGAIKEMMVMLARAAEGKRPEVMESRRLAAIESTGGIRTPEDGDFVVMHISDLHIGSGYGFRLRWRGGALNESSPSLDELLAKDLDELGLQGRIDALVLTGDLAAAGRGEEYSRAKDVVVALLERIGIGTDRLLLVPGNHDVIWDPGPLHEIEEDRKVSLEAFREFRERLFEHNGHFPQILNVPARAGGNRLLIVGFNSNYVAVPNTPSVGFVARAETGAAHEHLQRLLPARAPGDKLWVCLHHHVFPASSVTAQNALAHNISMTGNVTELLSWANDHNAEVILHGHEHQPSITVAQRWPGDAGEVVRSVAAIGAGSVSAKRQLLGQFARNQYYILISGESILTVLSRSLGETGERFVAHKQLTLNIH